MGRTRRLRRTLGELPGSRVVIGLLRGKLVVRDGPTALIDVGGVGYEVDVSAAATGMLAANPDGVVIYTHLVVREDAQALYGFANIAERDLFRTLIKVTGIGPRLALSLLSSVATDAFADAITSGNTAALERVPGVGRKTAQRLVVELRDKVRELSAITSVGSTPTTREAVLALIALGYRESIAAQVVGQVADGEVEWSTEDLIQQALKRMAAE
ncbi:MAG: Holliday junction branch migration protein RuvA [Pseudomonadales bacterium]|nr:Holliday junction branch migration protein RuvA [Pseudomonadales bacterium]